MIIDERFVEVCEFLGVQVDCPSFIRESWIEVRNVFVKAVFDVEFGDIVSDHIVLG